MSTRNRAAFTLVELLVVIAIIGILVSLISAAAMQTIGTAQRAACANNQHEIWTAIQVFESRKQRYPGWRVSVGNVASGRELSWAVQIMNNLGMSDVYDRWNDPAIATASLPVPGISLFMCPSDDQDTAGGPWLSYATNNGIPDVLSAGQVVESKANGLFFDHRTHSSTANRLYTNASDVMNKDGLAHTLGLGENRRLYNWSGYGIAGTTVLEYLTGFVWENYTTPPTNSWLKFPINQLNATTGKVLFETATDKDAARISSPHGNVAVVTFADGHSIFLNSSINYVVYNKLCTPNGAAVVNSSNVVTPQAPLDASEYIK